MRFSNELKYWIAMHVLPACKLAEWAGISPQSLSRFRDSSGQGRRLKGLETPTLERLWKAMGLYIQIPNLEDLLLMEHGEQLEAIERDLESNVLSAAEATKRCVHYLSNF